MARPKKWPITDRYKGLRDTPAPPNGLGRPPPSLNVRTAVGAVVNPDNIDKNRHLVTISRSVDVLEDERSHRRISEAAYSVGRQMLATFERARGPGNASNWAGASRIDAYTSRELAIIHGLDAARAIEALAAWLRRELGRIDANLVVRILGEGKSYAEVAALQGKSGDRGTRYIAARFRDALEALADAKAARGRDHGRRQDQSSNP